MPESKYNRPLSLRRYELAGFVVAAWADGDDLAYEGFS